MAQKLHALTDPRTTERARDVLDILLIDTVGELDYPEAAAAVVLLFEERGTHALPWRFEIPSIWRRELEAMAEELEFPVRNFAGIEFAFRSTLSELERHAELCVPLGE